MVVRVPGQIRDLEVADLTFAGLTRNPSQICTKVSTAMERSARFVVVLLLRHLAAAEFRENRHRLFGSVEPINTSAVVGVGVLRDLEHIVRSVVVKFHGQRIRREDVVGDVTAPLPGDAFVGRRVGDVCCQ